MQIKSSWFVLYRIDSDRRILHGHSVMGKKYACHESLSARIGKPHVDYKFFSIHDGGNWKDIQLGYWARDGY